MESVLRQILVSVTPSESGMLSGALPESKIQILCNVLDLSSSQFLRTFMIGVSIRPPNPQLLSLFETVLHLEMLSIIRFGRPDCKSEAVHSVMIQVLKSILLELLSCEGMSRRKNVVR
jgi:hypothetical protein